MNIDEMIKLKNEELLELKKKKASTAKSDGSESTEGTNLRHKLDVQVSGIKTNRVVVCAFCGSDKRLDQGVRE